MQCTKKQNMHLTTEAECFFYIFIIKHLGAGLLIKNALSYCIPGGTKIKHLQKSNHKWLTPSEHWIWFFPVYDRSTNYFKCVSSRYLLSTPKRKRNYNGTISWQWWNNFVIFHVDLNVVRILVIIVLFNINTQNM